MLSMVKSVVRRLLEDSLSGKHEGEWSVQGLGFFRLYLPNNTRLHLWDSRWKIKDVTEAHTHPWHFNSLVVVGSGQNLRLEETSSMVRTHWRRLIQCGKDACTLSDRVGVSLGSKKFDSLHSGCTYGQRAEEIHITSMCDGTVTLVARQLAGAVSDQAFVYSPVDVPEFVSAEPRPARSAEVCEAVSSCLKLKDWE